MLTDDPAGRFDLVTCLETLEHVGDVQRALAALLRMTAKLLLITVPIEVGAIGIAKFAAKTILLRSTFNDELQGSRLLYFSSLLSGSRISQFRRPLSHFSLHTGFDYRELEELLLSRKLCFEAGTHGWNRFYLIQSNASSPGKKP